MKKIYIIRVICLIFVMGVGLLTSCKCGLDIPLRYRLECVAGRLYFLEWTKCMLKIRNADEVHQRGVCNLIDGFRCMS